MTTVSGRALETYEEMDDKEIIDECMKTLRALFPKQDVPDPVWYRLSRWGRDPNAMMSYSYIGVGGTGEDYDVMSSEEMGGAVHFAGEVCWY